MSLAEKSLSSSSLGENSTVYCLCRSSDCSTFMIACDSCNIWYHGSCIGMSEKESAKIENFFCHRCRNKNPSLKIKYNRPTKEVEEKLKKCIRNRLNKEIQLLDPSYVPTGPIEKINNQRKNREHSSSMDTWTHEDSTSNQSDSSSSSNIRSVANSVHSLQFETLTSREEQEQINKRVSESSSVENIKRCSMTKPNEKRRREYTDHSHIAIKREPKEKGGETKKINERRRSRRTAEIISRQCYGPGCVYEARSSSKYCSDKCGLELARNRLLQFLPVRLMQWQTIPSIADSLNRTSIDEIRTEIETIKQRLVSLDDRKRQLDETIERGKQLKAVKEANKNETNVDEHDWMFFCILCNQEVSQKSYQRHIDKCYIRFESQVSYGSNMKSNIEGLFCDTYDRTTNLYCKRLKVICPEHARDPKVASDEACGCPLEKNLFELSDDLCLIPKRLCSKHFKWDRKRRAQIDLERLHELIRLEELIEKENRLRTAMQERGSVAGLLLHKTIVH